MIDAVPLLQCARGEDAVGLDEMEVEICEGIVEMFDAEDAAQRPSAAPNGAMVDSEVVRPRRLKRGPKNS